MAGVMVRTETAAAAPRAAPPRRLRDAGIWWELAALALLPLLVLARDAWAAQVVLLGLLLLVPGLVLLRAIGVSASAVERFGIYVPCASLIAMTASGLAVDLAGPHLGIAQPLRPWPLLVGLEAVCLALAALAALRGTAIRPTAGLPRSLRARDLWPLLLPLLAAAGAARLTNGHGPALAIASLAAGIAVLFVYGVTAGRWRLPQLSLVLYGVGLAAAWSFSLRGHFLYGFDISGEYHVLTSTTGPGLWHADHRADAYGAMLSLTVLPAGLSELTGIAPLLVLKAVYPALFALFPVGIFRIATRFVDRRFAFLAASFVVVQSYFFQQLPGIARQEIALLLFIALLAAVLEAGTTAGRIAWLALLSLGVVVSHYTTTYLSIMLVGVGAVLQLLVSFVRPGPRLTATMVAALLSLIGGAALWYGAVTHSSQNIGQFTANLREHGLDVLPNASRGQGLVNRYLQGNATKRVPAARYAGLAEHEYHQTRPYVHPLKAASAQRFALRDASLSGTKSSSRLLDELGVVGLVLAQLANLLAIIGAVALMLRRRSPPLVRQLGMLGVAALVGLAFVRLSGTAADAYNQERAFLQTMAPLAICIAGLLAWAARRRPRLGVVVSAGAALALAVIFFNASGLRDVAAGKAGSVNLADRGEDYERFYVTAPELAAGRWIGARPKGSLLYADRYGQLRILAATGRSNGLMLDLTPQTLDRNAWIYGSRTNVTTGRVRGQIASTYAIYRWPAIIDAHYDRVYSSGSAVVYHRPSR